MKGIMVLSNPYSYHYPVGKSWLLLLSAILTSEKFMNRISPFRMYVIFVDYIYIYHVMWSWHLSIQRYIHSFITNINEPWNNVLCFIDLSHQKQGNPAWWCFRLDHFVLPFSFSFFISAELCTWILACSEALYKPPCGCSFCR